MNSLSLKPFAKKFFYLDLKGFANEKKLIKDLELLGGKQEVFLSKTVSFVVSNRISFSESGSPSTPMSNTKSISPYLIKDSSLDNRDSPASNSPVFEQKLSSEQYVPLSRGMSVLQKAREKYQGNNKFILDICNQWSIKVYPIQKVLSWIEKYKSKYYKRISTKHKQELTSENATKLYCPFAKIEDEDRKYKPRYKAFPSWEEYTDSVVPRSLKKLITNFKLFGNVDFSARPPLKQINVQPLISNQSAKSTHFTQAFEHSASIASGYQSSKATRDDSSKRTRINGILNSVSASKPVGKQTEKCSRNQKAKKEKQVKKKKLYCEICGVYFSDYEAHYANKLHAKFQNNSANYDIVQKEIDGLPTLDEFLKNHLARDIVEEVKELSEDTPMEVENCSVEDTDDCLKVVEDKVDSCLTEVYNVNANDFVSASCSSVGSALPYLETVEIMSTKNVDLGFPSVAYINIHDSSSEKFSSQTILNKSYEVPLELINHSVGGAAIQTLEKLGPNCEGLDNISDITVGDRLIGLINQSVIKNASPVQENENIKNKQIKSVNIAQNFINYVPITQGYEISITDFDPVSPLEQTQSLSQQPIISIYNDKWETPLDLSNYSKNNEKVILNKETIIVDDYLVDKTNELSTLNEDLPPPLICPKLAFTDVNSTNAHECNTVDVNSEAESYNSEPNLPGFDAIISNCLQEVTKSLVHDVCTVEEDGLSDKVQCQNFHIVESFPLDITNIKENKEDCYPDSVSVFPRLKSVVQTGCFEEKLIENPTMNYQPSNKSVEQFHMESDASIYSSVNGTNSGLHQSKMGKAIFPEGNVAAAKKDWENPPSVASNYENVNETVLHSENIPKSLEKSSFEQDSTLNVSIENSEKYLSRLTSSLVRSIQATVSSELLASDNAYLVLDEADFPISSEKEVGHGNKINYHNAADYTINNSVEAECHKVKNPNNYLVTKTSKQDNMLSIIEIENKIKQSLNIYDETADDVMKYTNFKTVSKIEMEEKHEIVYLKCNNANQTKEIKDNSETKQIQIDYILNDNSIKEKENNAYDIKESSGINLVEIKNQNKDFHETEHNLKYSSSTSLASEAEAKEKVYCNEMVRSVSDTVCKIQERDVKENKGICNKELHPLDIKESEEVDQNNMKCSNADACHKMQEKKTEEADYNGMGKSVFDHVRAKNHFDCTQEMRCSVKSILNDCEAVFKNEIHCNEMEYSVSDSVYKISERRMSGNEEYQLDTVIANEGIDKGSEGVIEQFPITEAIINLEPHFYNRQSSGNSNISGASSANNSINDNSPCYESSFCSFNESNTSLDSFLSLPSNDSSAVGLQDTEKPVHIVYLNSPILPNNSIPLKQGSAEGVV